MSQPFTVVMIARTSPRDFADFIAFENRFLGLFEKYDMVLERRLRSQDECIEIHLIKVANQDCLERYMLDPDRTALLPQFRKLEVAQQIVRVEDADTQQSHGG